MFFQVYPVSPAFIIINACLLEKNKAISYNEYYEKLTHGKITKEELIERSFEFLLKRESKESILSRFNLKVINIYFPEYEFKIKLT